MTTLDRYLLREIAVPLVVGLGLFFVVVAFGQVLQISDAVTGLGVSATDMAQAMLYSLPPLTGLLLPVSMLFATLLGVGRIASDREVRGLCAAGVSPYRLLRVPLLVGTLLGLVSLVAMIKGEPWGIRGLRDLMARSAQHALAEGARPGVFHEWLPGTVFYAGARHGDLLDDVFFADLRNRRRPIVISARQGRVRTGTRARDIVLEMLDGNMVLRGPGDASRVLSFDHGEYRLDVDSLVGNKAKTLPPVQEKTVTALWRGSHDRALPASRRAQLTVVLDRRFALPLATIIFALLAVPLASRPSGNARARGFLYSAFIVGAYYYVGRAVELAARHGNFPPRLAAWVPDLVGLVGLVVLLWRFRRSAA